MDFNEDGNITITEEKQLTKTTVNPDLRALDERIERVELGLRELVHGVVGDDPNNIPQHVLRRIDDRIQRATKKNPVVDEDYLQTSEGKLEYIDLRELEDTITNKTLWPEFEPIFRNKVTLGVKFGQLAELRNCIRHSRNLDKITLMEGEASILWFEKILNK